jgi:hypothetical protein
MQDDNLNNVALYTLFLTVEVPSSSGVDLKHLRSPLAALACFQGLNSDPLAPEWTHLLVGIPIVFRQPRGAIVEVFSALAWWGDNHLEVSHNQFFLYSLV